MDSQAIGQLATVCNLPNQTDVWLLNSFPRTDTFAPFMNDFTIGLAASPWIVLAIILAAAGVAIYTYRSTLPPATPPSRWTLIALRTIGVGLLLLALFQPVLSMLTVTAEPPELLIAIDNSESMALPGLDSARIGEARSIAATVAAASELASQTSLISISDSIRSLPPDSLARVHATGTESRLAAVFSAAADTLRGKNLRAILLLTDGRYNAGPNPIQEAQSLGVPVFAVGLGDSVEPRDISVQQVFTNEVAYVDAELPVEVRVRSAGLQSGGALNLTLRDDAGVIGTQQLQATTGTADYTTTFTYRPRTPGTAKLTATVGAADNTAIGTELTPRNNSRSVFVKVKSNKRKYLLIAGGPNPDVAFLKRLLAQENNIEVRSYIQKEQGEFLEGKLDAGAFRDAEALVLVDFPTRQTSPADLATIRAALGSGNLPLMVVNGSRMEVNALKTLEPFLPVTLGVGRPTELQVFPSLTDAGKNSAILRGTNLEAWGALPPIFTTETAVQPKPESEVLATTRIGSTQLGEPLVVTRRLGRSRSIFVSGYGLYRWQLIGDGQREVRGEQGANVLGDFINGSLRWLATHEEQKQVRIVASKPLYNLGEPVRLLGQAYDDSYAPISDAQMEVNVSGGGRSFPLTLAATGNGRYEATLSNLPAGDYSFAGRAIVGGKELGSDEGRFTIGEVGLELLQTSMNAELLRTLAERTGGRFYTTRQVGELMRDILSHKGFAPRSIQHRADHQLWNNLYLLLAALAAFAMEWLLRKRSGML